MTNRSSRYAKPCWLHEAACTRMQCKWFTEQSIAAHIFSCQYVDKSSWQDERKVFREDEGTTSVVLDEQKRLGFAELAGMRLCSFFLKLRLKMKAKCKSSIVIARILCKHDSDYAYQIFPRCMQIHHPYILPDSANVWLILGQFR